jgi:FkbM family methyltransferase
VRSSGPIRNNTEAGIVGDETIFPKVKAGKLWEPHLVVLFEKYIRPWSTAIDCGANIGLHSISMSVKSHAARVLAFEPHPEIYQALLANSIGRPPKIVPINMAVSDRAGFLLMKPLRDSVNPAGAMVFRPRMFEAFQESAAYQVTTVRLDDMACDDISFGKIDVEGHEMSVIDGATHMLASQRPVIVMEIWDLDDPKVRNAKIDRVNALGYRAEPVSEIDVLFTPA